MAVWEESLPTVKCEFRLGRDHQVFKRKEQEEKRLGERGLEWNLPQRTSAWCWKLMLHLSTKRAELRPDVQNEAGGFPGRVREFAPGFQVLKKI